METAAFPDEIRSIGGQFDAALGVTTLPRVRFRSGRSGAFVGLVDCQGRYDGVFVLKIDTKLKGERELRNHLRAIEIGAFQGKIPSVVDSFDAGDQVALLLKLAGGSRITWRPLVESLNLFASGDIAAARALWSPQRFSLASQKSGAVLIADTLGRKLTPEHGRILHHARVFFGSEIATARAFHHLGELLPNPLHFALNSEAYDAPLLRALLGPCHGDCHAGNLIVETGYSGTVRDISLIDLAYFQETAPFFYDTAYLELFRVGHPTP